MQLRARAHTLTLTLSLSHARTNTQRARAHTHTHMHTRGPRAYTLTHTRKHTQIYTLTLTRTFSRNDIGILKISTLISRTTHTTQTCYILTHSHTLSHKGWDVDEGNKGGSGLEPQVLISLTAPKMCSKSFSGVCCGGGRGRQL